MQNHWLESIKNRNVHVPNIDLIDQLCRMFGGLSDRELMLAAGTPRWISHFRGATSTRSVQFGHVLKTASFLGVPVSLLLSSESDSEVLNLVDMVPTNLHIIPATWDWRYFYSKLVYYGNVIDQESTRDKYISIVKQLDKFIELHPVYDTQDTLTSALKRLTNQHSDFEYSTHFTFLSSTPHLGTFYVRRGSYIMMTPGRDPKRYYKHWLSAWLSLETKEEHTQELQQALNVLICDLQILFPEFAIHWSAMGPTPGDTMTLLHSWHTATNHSLTADIVTRYRCRVQHDVGERLVHSPVKAFLERETK